MNKTRLAHGALHLISTTAHFIDFRSDGVTFGKWNGIIYPLQLLRGHFRMWTSILPLGGSSNQNKIMTGWREGQLNWWVSHC